MGVLDIDTTRTDPNYYRQWMQEKLPLLQRKFSNEDQVYPRDYQDEVLKVLSDPLVPEFVHAPLSALLTYLRALSDYNSSFPVRSLPTLNNGEKPSGEVYRAPGFPGALQLFLVTDADGRVLNCHDEPTNYVMSKERGLSFQPRSSRPKLDLQPWF